MNSRKKLNVGSRVIIIPLIFVVLLLLIMKSMDLYKVSNAKDTFQRAHPEYRIIDFQNLNTFFDKSNGYTVVFTINGVKERAWIDNDALITDRMILE